MPTGSLNLARCPETRPHHLPETISACRTQEPVRTIHRRTASHHGSTLRILGHAAEHLARLSTESPTAGDREAIRTLMRLSREIFDDYAATTRQHHPVTDWIMNRAVRIYGAA